MANLYIEPTKSKLELITDIKANETEHNRVVYSTGPKINQPSVGNIVLYGASTVGGGAPQPPPSTSTGSGQIFPTGRQ